MSKKHHQPVVDLLNDLAATEKYVTLSIHDKPFPAPVAEISDRPCKVWGYDPKTSEKVCIQY